ncbi:MAG: AtpZ/AtpI family protein [Arcobacteraceae bacterium]|nr:AtpZ/AtpI family protein [Arcobacteraceae bacterium]
MSNEEITPKHRDKVEALDNLSLGISIVVAIVLGVAIGMGFKSWTGYSWTLWLGVFWGIAAAVMNIYKSYKKAQKGYDELLKDPKYKYAAEHGINKIDDDD